MPRILTAGIDVQADCIEVEIVGWGTDEERRSLGRVRVFGDPSVVAAWLDLDRLIPE